MGRVVKGSLLWLKIGFWVNNCVDVGKLGKVESRSYLFMVEKLWFEVEFFWWDYVMRFFVGLRMCMGCCWFLGRFIGERM